MTSTLTSNNTISAVGNYRVVAYTAPFQDVEVIGYDDSIQGEPPMVSPSPGYSFKREWRWSVDNVSWSLWYPLLKSAPDFSALDGQGKFWAQFRYSVESDTLAPAPSPPGTAISPVAVIEWIDLKVRSTSSSVPAPASEHPPTRCSAEGSFNPALIKNATFNPYAVNKATQMAEQLSSSVARMFGHEVTYFRVVPQDRSRDIVFMEWTIMYAQEPKCFKLLVPNNQFPDSKVNYNPFGPAFEIPFEVHIDRTEWENTFGKNTMPQEGDFLYMPIQNRMYEIQSSYAFKDFMQVPIYYKAMLVKYENRQSVLKTDGIEAMLKEATISTEEMFGEDLRNQEIDALKPQQNVAITGYSDPTRSYVARQLTVTKYNIYNNWNLVSDNYYDMKGMYALTGASEVAVTYEASGQIKSGDARAVMFWIAPSGGNTGRRTVISCEDPAGRGWRVDLNWAPSPGGCSITLRYNGSDYVFPLLGVTLLEDSWYAVCVNFSTKYKQCSASVYQTQVGAPDLQRMFWSSMAFTDAESLTGAKLGLLSGQHLLTNVRVFNDMVEQESEALVLTQNIVADASKALVVDNAKPILRIARVGKP